MPNNPYYFSAHWKALCAAVDERDHGICVVQGCGQRGVVHDHIKTRPPVQHPCDLDRIDNVRLLCVSHDAQVKEFRGKRKQGGEFKVRGCDSTGRSLDPKHGWNR